VKQLLGTILMWAVVLGAVAAQQDQRAPLSKAEVLDLVKSSVSTKIVIGVVHQYGIAFKPTDEVLDEFRKAGADNALLAALREAAVPESTKPLTDKDILILLAEGTPSDAIVKSVQQRGIDFEPSDENLVPLRTAGASEALVQAVRDAKRVEPFVAQSGPPDVKPSGPTVTSTHEEGKEATVVCPPSASNVPVFGNPAGDTIVDRLQCGDRITFTERNPQPFGVDKIQYGGGKVGYVWDRYLYLGGMAPLDPKAAGVTPPRPIHKPEPSYTREARHDKVQGIVTLWIVVDAQGNVAEAREVSGRLGDGLDEKAIETIRTWKFRPAMREGVPVPVRVMVEVSFRLR
jgi:TonB family protein